MKKIYLIEKSEGRWEDRYDYIDRAYIKKEDAEKYILKYNSKLELLRYRLDDLYRTKSKEENYDDLFWNRYHKYMDKNKARLRECELYDVFRKESRSENTRKRK